MKKILLVAEGPVGKALHAVITAYGMEVVQDAASADVAVAHRREEVFKVLEDTQLPVWQLVYREPVNNKRVRTFDLLDEFPKMLAELKL